MSYRWNSIRERTSSKFLSEPVRRLSMTATSLPCASSARTNDEPMNPAPPVTAQRFIGEPPLFLRCDGDQRHARPREQTIDQPPDPDGLVKNLQRQLIDVFLP